MTSSETLRALQESIRKHAREPLLVVTGAGVSLASGIPTFRGTDPGAVWASDLLELGTNAYFERDPVGSWRWYLQRFDGLRAARPNAAHVALREWELLRQTRGHGPFLLTTQNVDSLHEQAGSETLVKVHGSADRVRCVRHGCQHGAPAGSLPRERADFTAFLAEPALAHLPRCPACGSLLRQHVLWFDETYDGHASYRFEEVLDAARHAALVLFVGTSFSVGVTDWVLHSAVRRSAEIFSIDPAGEKPHWKVQAIPLRAEEALPALVESLRD